MTTYSDYGVEHLAFLCLDHLARHIDSYSVPFGTLMFLDYSLSRFEADVIRKHLTEKLQGHKALSDKFGDIRGRILELIVVQLKVELENGFNVFLTNNFKKKPTLSPPSCFSTTIRSLSEATPLLIRKDKLMLLVQISGIIDHSLIDLVWKNLSLPFVKSITIVDLKNLASEIVSLNSVLRKIQAAADLLIPMYHEEILKFCDLFLRLELRAVNDFSTLRDNLKHTDPAKLKAILKKYEELKVPELPNIPIAEVKRVLKFIP